MQIQWFVSVFMAASMALPLALQAGTLGDFKDVAFTAKVDGTEQRYVLALPEAYDPNRAYPVLIALHGCTYDRWEYPRGTNDESRAVRDMAAKYGTIFVCPDYRATRSWMGPAAEADMLQMIQELKAQYKVSKVFLTGGSMGGFSTLSFAAMHPELISGICAQNGVANLFEYDLWTQAMIASYGGTKKQAPDQYKRRSAEYWPERFTMPVAMTTGGQDGLCPCVSCHRLANVLQRLGVKLLLLHRPAGKHSTTYDDCVAEFDYMMMTVNLRDGFALPKGEKNLLQGGGLFCAGLLPDVPANSGQREIGLQFAATEDGRLTAVHFFKSPGEAAVSHDFRLWDGSGKKVLEFKSDREAGFGWHRIGLEAAFAVKKGESYVVSYGVKEQYPGSPGFFEGQETPESEKIVSRPVAKPGITAIDGVYCPEINKTVPENRSYNTNYFVDVELEKK